MDLMKLGTTDFGGNPYLPDKMIEGWSSLIWTERYREAGDFQLKTPAIAETLAMIPDGSMVALRESEEVMRVETHSIDVNDDGVEELTVVGRSFETILEQRQIYADYQIPYPMKQLYKVQDAAGVILYNTLTNPVNTDATGGPYPHDGKEDVGIEITLENIVLQKTASTTSPKDPSDLQSTVEWYLENGDAYQPVLDMLTLGDLGIRSRKPYNDGIDSLGAIDNVFSVSATGLISYPSGNTGLGMCLEIYNGRNRSLNPSTVDPLPPIAFRADAGHIERPKYLISRKDYKNFARVVSSYGEIYVWDGDDGYVAGGNQGVPVAAPSGLNRYELYLDLGTVDASVANPTTWMRQKGKAALKAHNRQVAIDGAISAKAPYRFGVDYGLGDLVQVIGRYNVSETMQVSEFVRSQDQNGFASYPTLIRQAIV